MKNLILSIIFFAAIVCASEADQICAQGVEALRAAQDDASKLVGATKLLAKAAALYEAEDNEARVVEVNACLYWAKKKLTLYDLESIKSSAIVSKKLEAVSRPVDASESSEWLARADLFAKEHGSDQLLVAIHYFEVADRFKDTDAGRKAMGASLLAMQGIKSVIIAKPVAQKKLDVAKPGALDLQHVDYEHLTASQWDSIQSKMIVFRVLANKAVDTKIDVQSGDEFVLLPHPDDLWWCLILADQPSRNTQTNFRGFCEKTGTVVSYGKVAWRFAKESDRHEYDARIEGSGRLILQMSTDLTHPTWSKGEIRVKLVKVK